MVLVFVFEEALFGEEFGELDEFVGGELELVCELVYAVPCSVFDGGEEFS